MTIQEFLQALIGLNWQAIVALFMVNGIFYWLLKAEIETINKRLDALDERMFYLATGQTLAEAIKAERLKNLS